MKRSDGQKANEAMRESIARLEERRRLGKGERRRTLATVAAVAGMGWSIVIPALIGFAVGHWLDLRSGTGIVLSAGLGLVGLAFGCVAAWKRIARLD